MFDAGADDYVPKPFIGELLLARIFSRLERVALYRALADVDALTGASNRRKSMEDIERLLRIADRAQQPVCLVILGIDNFKAINDAHGHLSRRRPSSRRRVARRYPRGSARRGQRDPSHGQRRASGVPGRRR
jgi:PleD family two-component response regulator